MHYVHKQCIAVCYLLFSAERWTGCYLLFGCFCWLDTEVYIVHRPFNECDGVWSVGLRVHAHVSHRCRNISEWRLKDGVTFTFWHLQLTFRQDLRGKQMDKDAHTVHSHFKVKLPFPLHRTIQGTHSSKVHLDIQFCKPQKLIWQA